jgi:hypothetical protein
MHPQHAPIAEWSDPWDGRNTHDRSIPRRVLGCLAAAVFLAAGVTTAAAPPALAASHGNACVVTADGCVHRTTVASGTSVDIRGVFHRNRVLVPKWGGARRADVLMHVVGSATGFAEVARLRSRAPGSTWHYTTRALEGSAVYVFRFRMHGDLSDRAIVVVTAP